MSAMAKPRGLASRVAVAPMRSAMLSIVKMALIHQLTSTSILLELSNSTTRAGILGLEVWIRAIGLIPLGAKEVVTNRAVDDCGLLLALVCLEKY